jgi:prepilin-type N-terminal cleavage/methylation domain-containing protein
MQYRAGYIYQQSSTGFTLIEMLIAISIIVLVSGVGALSLPRILSQTRVTTSTQEILTVLRDARNRSISIVEFLPGANEFPSYGVYINRTTAPRQIILYADCKIDDFPSPNGDGRINDLDNFRYDATSTRCPSPRQNGLVETIDLHPSIQIAAIRSYIPQSGGGVTQTVENQVHVEFLRPEPSIWITVMDGARALLLDVGRVEIDIQDTNGLFERTLVIWTTGHLEIL